MRFFTGIETILKYIWKLQKAQMAKLFLKKKTTKTKVSTISDFRTHYEAIVNKIV
jgi:hypothetical protein